MYSQSVKKCYRKKKVTSQTAAEITTENTDPVRVKRKEDITYEGEEYYSRLEQNQTWRAEDHYDIYYDE